MLDLTALKRNKVDTSALKSGGGFPMERKPVGQFISQAPPQTFFQKLTSKIPSAIREGFVGTGQTVDLAGKPVFDTGLIGMFRPFGFGKSKEEKASDRIDLLSPLVSQGTITQDRMNEIIKDIVVPSGMEAIQKGMPIKKEKLELTRPEKIALRPVRIEEALDQVFGVLDLFAFGVMKPISRTLAGKIAKSKIANEITNLLKKEMPKISDEAGEVFGKALVEIDDVSDVQKVLNRTEMALQELGKKAGKVDTSALRIEPRKPVGFGEIKPTPTKSPLIAKARKYKTTSESKFGVRYTKEMKDKAIQFYKDGKSSTEISKELGVSSARVLIWAEEVGIKRTISQSKLLYEKDIPKVLELYKQGKNSSEISKELNLVRSSVSRWIKDAGLARSNSEAQSMLAELGKTNVKGVRSRVSTKFGIILADSTYEAIRIKQLNNDPNIVSIKRATRIPFGENHHYVPDIEIKYKDGSIVIEEIKPIYKVGNEKVVAKEKAAKEFYKNSNTEYRIITENDIGFNAFKNANLENLTFGNEETKARFLNAINKAKTKTKPQLKQIWEEARGVKKDIISKEKPQKIIETKPIAQPVSPEKDFLVQNSLTKSVKQEVQTVKKIKQGLDPAEVKEIKQIPEKTAEVLCRKEIEPKFLSPNEVEYLDQKRMELIFIEDQITNHPAKPLKKYFSYRIGALPEVTGKGTSLFAKKGDDMVTEMGYENSEDARADIHNLFTLEERAKDLKSEIKELALVEKDEIALNKILNKRKPKAGITKVILADNLTTRRIKQRPHYQSFIKYAEKYIKRDIHKPTLNRHLTMTAERVAEYLDEGIGGRVYREIVKPVYDSAVDMTKELHTIKNEVKKFKVIEGSINDRDASLFAQKKIDIASEKSKALAKYSREKYDEWLVRMNEKRAKMGVEPIKRRKDYITHLNEINVLTELLGGVDRITIKHRISRLKNEMLDRDASLSPIVAFERAKRQVEGTTGLDMYIDARQPIFKYAKRRLGEYEKNPSVLRSVKAYSRSAMRYIYQAENVAKNKAYKDALPANAKEFFRLWNTEQVAGRTPSSIMNPQTKRMVQALRGTLGANTILGNMATTVMQLTSFPQVVALAGARNTMYGIITRLGSYLSKSKGTYSLSRTKILRNLNIDIGMGNSLVDSLLIKVGEMEKLRNTTAYTRLSVDFGRNLLMGIMETADQFTVGASFEAFQRKAILDGVKFDKSLEYADIMTGKTQANYYKEALPPFLNTVGGKVLGQFGTYGFNQWEMIRKDFGKALKLDKKTPKETKLLFKHFLYTLIAAYLVDMVSEDVFGRQPYDIKDLVDEGIAMTQGKTDLEHLVKQGKETAMSYVPFMGSVKFKSMPPVLDFGSDVLHFMFGGDKMKVAKATKDLKEKWALSVLMPYGGNQVRKTLQGVKFEDERGIEKTKALLFGKWATEQGQQFFENIKQKEITKNKIEKAVETEDYSKLSDEEKTSATIRSSIRDNYSFVGNITEETNLNKIQNLSKETQEIFINTYSETTQKTIRRKLKETPKSTKLFLPKGGSTGLFPPK